MSALRLPASLLLASAIALGILSACGGGDGDGDGGGGSGGGGATFTPTTEPVAVTPLPVGFSNPTAMAFLPDGRFIVVTSDRYLRLYEADGASYMYLNHAAFAHMAVGPGETGLRDVAVDPAFESNRRLYFTFAEGSDVPLARGTAVARAELTDNGDLVPSYQVIYRQPKVTNGGFHYGGRMAFDRQGHLFVTLGDREIPEQRVLAQDVSTGNGKVVHITTDGAPAPGNPDIPGGLPGLWSWGHRNPEGAAIHPETGQLWTHEAGPQGGDEINLTLPGRNYGWPVIGNGQVVGTLTPWGEGTSKPGMEQPLAVWDTSDGSPWIGGPKSSIGPKGLAFFTGDRPAHWKGSMFLGAYEGGGLWRIQFDGTREVGRERLFADQLDHIVDVRMGPDGALYVLMGAPHHGIVKVGG